MTVSQGEAFGEGQEAVRKTSRLKSFREKMGRFVRNFRAPHSPEKTEDPHEQMMKDLGTFLEEYDGTPAGAGFGTLAAIEEAIPGSVQKRLEVPQDKNMPQRNIYVVNISFQDRIGDTSGRIVLGGGPNQEDLESIEGVKFPRAVLTVGADGNSKLRLESPRKSSVEPGPSKEYTSADNPNEFSMLCGSISDRAQRVLQDQQEHVA